MGQVAAGIVPGLVGGRWCLGLEGLVPPPVGAFAERSGTRWDRRWWGAGWAGQRSGMQVSAVGVGDDEVLGGAGDRDAAAVMGPVVIRAEQHQVCCKLVIHPLRVVYPRISGGPRAE